MAFVIVIACLECGCGEGPILVNQAPPPAAAPDMSGIRPTDPRLQGGILGTAARAFGASLPQFCMIHHRHRWTQTGIITGGPPAVPDTVFVGPDGQPTRTSPEQCEQENQKSLAAEEVAYQQSTAASQQAAADAQRKRAAELAAIVRDEESRGYKRISVKDLYLDGKSYAAGGARVAVHGFFKARDRHDERLYSSYDDFMMHSFQSTDALYVGLLTENGSRQLRESLLSCQAGCNVTILGHVDQCLETRLLATSSEVCLVADDLGASEN
jgi:hypothetical protein